ncbi:MAG: putative bifunctional diguanylate cyclase/phosphodiesterase [Janthinobacterium lividum]
MSFDAGLSDGRTSLRLDSLKSSGENTSLTISSIVRSAAYASDCTMSAFIDGLPGDRSILTSVGMSEAAASDGLTWLVDHLSSPGSQETSIINDVIDSCDAAVEDAFLLSRSTIRFVAVFWVKDRASKVLGALLVADAAPHAGLSAAQVYVLQTHASQISAFFELQNLREQTETPRNKTGRWSDAERLRLLESVVVNANDAVLITDAEPIDLPGPRIVYCNAAFERTTGYSEAEVLGKTPRILQSGAINRGSLDRLKSALRKWRPVEVELLNQHKDGTEFWVELSIVPVANEKGWFTHWVSVQRDITDRKRNEETAVRARVAEAENVLLENEIEERKKVEARLLYEAYHDDLTKLRNRAYFMDRLQIAVGQLANRPGVSCTVLFLDLNRFKLINDSLGHRAGDLLLMETAHRLRTCLRGQDTLARIGGDEFAMLLENTTDIAAGVAAAQRVVEALRPPVRIGDQDIFSSASVGIAQSSDQCRVPEEILRNADIAMYEAKARGTTGSAVFTASMHADAVEALGLQTDLRHAVARGEFHLDFQPIYNPRTRRITGMEALVRWQHPERGLIGAVTFIPLAEEIGLIGDIGRWVLLEACSHMRRWVGSYPDLALRMSVNASGDELRDPQYLPFLRKVLASTGLDPRCLQIEITESVFLSRPEAVGKALEAIRALGARVALDDFGTGYSSLGYLDRYPIDTIKIDRSFVVRMLTRRRTLAIVETIITLGRSLGLDIVAEGVEDEEQLRTLLALNCNSIQGYLFARPMSASEIDALLKNTSM